SILAIQEHVDPTIIKPYQLDKKRYIEMVTRDRGQLTSSQTSSGNSNTLYNDLWELDAEVKAQQRAKREAELAEAKRFPPRPEKDLVWFIEEYSTALEDWQRDILTMLRDEMLYFYPQ